MKKFNALILLLFVSSSLLAQSFTGKVVMEITYGNLPQEMAGMESMLPKGNTIFIKGENSRFEQNMMGTKTTVITKNRNATMLMDMSGQKYKLEFAEDEIEQSIENQKLNYEKTGESKTILGYQCDKYKVTSASLPEPMEVFITQELPTPFIRGFEGIEGFPMEYQVKNQGMTIDYKVTEISKQPVSDDMFMIPEGYQELPDNMKQMMGIK